MTSPSRALLRASDLSSGPFTSTTVSKSTPEGVSERARSRRSRSLGSVVGHDQHADRWHLTGGQLRLHGGPSRRHGDHGTWVELLDEEAHTGEAAGELGRRPGVGIRLLGAVGAETAAAEQQAAKLGRATGGKKACGGLEVRHLEVEQAAVAEHTRPLGQDGARPVVRDRGEHILGDKLMD